MGLGLNRKRAVPSEQQKPAAVEVHDHTTPAAQPKLERAGLDAALLRGMIREELQAALGDGAEALPVAKASEPAKNDEGDADSSEPAQPTPAYQQAKVQVAEELRRGTWTESSREQLSSALGNMSESERKEVILEVIRASNEGKLRVDVAGPLFL